MTGEEKEEVRMRRPLRRPKFAFNIPASYLEAIDLYNRGQFEQALPYFRQACEEKPAYADFLYGLARCLVMVGDDHGALVELSETLRLNPYYVDALLEVAFIMARQGEIGQARGYFAEALRFFRYGTTDQEKLDERRERCAGYFEEGINLCMQGRIKEANEAFYLASNLKPDELTYQFNEAVTAYGNGDLEQARTLLESIIETEPYFLDAYHVLGQIALSQGRERDAIDLYKRALAIRADYPDFHAGLGEAYLVAGQVDRAVEALERALVYNPRYSEAYFYLGRAYMAQGQLVKAKQALEELVRYRPSDGLAYLSLGEVLEGLGQSVEAFVAYERAASCPESMELARRRLAELAAQE